MPSMTQEQFKIFLENEPLVHADPTRAMVDHAFLERPSGSLYYGTGLATPKAASIGLPFDVLVLILVAEKVRRQFGLDTINHHIADTHALTNDFCNKEDVRAMAEEYRDILSRIARVANIPLAVRFSSEFDSSDTYHALLARVKTDKAEYVKRELADILWYHDMHDVRFKLGWLVQSTEIEIGFDERLYDREFRRVCQVPLSFGYVVAGRTLDLKRMRASPYISVPGENRILFKPGERVRAKFEAALPQWGEDKTLGGVTRHLRNILRLWDRLTGNPVARGADVLDRVQAIIDLVFG